MYTDESMDGERATDMVLLIQVKGLELKSPAGSP